LTSEHSTPASTAPGDIFATTHWTVVLAAGRRHTPQSDGALEELVPHLLVSALRLRPPARPHQGGRGGFGAGVLRAVSGEELSRGLSAERGRFRAFLLASLKHFLINEWRKSQRLKRGGGEARCRWTGRRRTRNFRSPPPNEPSPDKAFDREWALACWPRSSSGCSAECAADGKAKLFEQLKIFLTAGKGRMSHAEAAQALAWMKGRARGGAPAAEALPRVAARRNRADAHRSGAGGRGNAGAVRGV
jgi:DNA-directed RNA polymerase specialized sigma24 family protein